MKPKIKSVHTYIINDFTPEEGQLTLMQVNDEQGNLILQEQYYPDGKVEQKIERAYDAENRLIEEKHFAEGDTPHQVIHQTFDENSKVKQRIVSYQDGAKSTTDFVYDLSAFSEEATTKDEAGNVEEKHFLRYDKEGRVLEEIEYGEDAVFVKSTKSSYNEAGRTLEKHFKTEEEEYTQYYDYEYDEEGRIVYAEIFDEAEDLIRTDEITYDENGNHKEIVMKSYADGWAFVDHYEYDEQNQLKKQERVLPNGELLESKEYQRNEHGMILEEEIRNRNGWTIHRHQFEFFATATS